MFHSQDPLRADGHPEGGALRRQRIPRRVVLFWRGEPSSTIDLKGPHACMGRRGGRTRRLAMGCPLIPHRARAIELAGAREPRDKGTEGSADTATPLGGSARALSGLEGPAPPCPKSPLEGGRTGWEYVRMVTFFEGGPTDNVNFHHPKVRASFNVISQAPG